MHSGQPGAVGPKLGPRELLSSKKQIMSTVKQIWKAAGADSSQMLHPKETVLLVLAT